MTRRALLLLAGLLATAAVWLRVDSAAPLSTPTAFVPQAAAGLRVTRYAVVPSAREMALGADGTVYVGSSRAGRVYAVARGGDVRVLASGLQMPIGVALHDGDLYVSAVSRILRIVDVARHADPAEAPQIVVDDLPTETHHGGRFIAFGPDGWLYVPIGAPCNVCDRPGFAELLRMDADGRHRQVVARGIRNTVGFDWRPADGSLWFTDNGRDNLGDDIPSDELNRVAHPGQHFGFPYCHAGTVPDPRFGAGHDCADYVPPVFKPGAHVAAVGMRFWRGPPLGPIRAGDVVIAEHGSWNRSTKVGYRVVVVHLDAAGRPIGQNVVLDGFLDGQGVRGRPADVLELADHSLLVADDAGGVLWRVAVTDPH